MYLTLIGTYSKRLLSFFIAVVLLISLSGTSLSQKAEALPANFQISDVSDGFIIPSGLEVLSDGRIFVTELTGEVKIYKDGQVLSQPFITIPVNATVDRGLLGIASDPAFGSSPYVYFYYTDENNFNTVARANASSDIATDFEVLYQVPQPSPGQHAGGTVRFGGDGKLYVSIGDNQTPTNSQDPSNVFGSILRLNKDGSVPTDNPFIGQPGISPEVYAYGFRNPFRMQADSQSGAIYVGDVGQGTWEEVNLLQAGGNYGWPTAEGECDCGFVDPIYQYPHVDDIGSITMGPVYRGGNFPSEHGGSLFISDYSLGFLRELQLDGNGSSVVGETEFATNLGTVVDIKQAPDGALYMVTIFPGKLMKLSYDSDNSLPVVSATSDVTSGGSPLTVNFSSNVFDADGDTLTYAWDFGDGTTSSLQNPLKRYELAGQYSAQLTVSDGTGSVASSTIVIQVGQPPTVTITAPNEGDTYFAGDTFDYSIVATDSSGVAIPADDVVSRTVLHHTNHTHPHLGPFRGNSGSFTIPTTGETSTDTWYRLVTTVTDSNGLQSETSVSVYPRVGEFTIATSPSGLEVLVNGEVFSQATQIDSLIGFERELSAPTYQTIGSQWYEFVSWSDGEAEPTRLFTTPEATATITANYVRAQAPGSFFAEYYDNETLSGAPTFTQFEDRIDYSWPLGTGPGGGLQDDHFSARWTNVDSYQAGQYTFNVVADDGVRVYLDGELIIDEWQLQGATLFSSTKSLDGEHEIVIEYFEREIDARITFEIEGGGVVDPGPDPVPGDYAARYWNLPNPEQYLVAPPQIPQTTADYQVNEQSIDYYWGADSPLAGTINPDRFVAVWEKRDTFESGTYRFTTTSDDGVRVYVDDVLVIDQWNDHATTTHSVDVPGLEGARVVRVEYYENGYDAVMQFDYSHVSGPVDPDPDPEPADTNDQTPNDGQYTARYWELDPAADFPPQIANLGAADFVQNESEINHDWDMGGPVTIGNDYFAVQWVKTDQFEAGTYDFSTFTDDGVRLYVDDQLVIDQWNDQSATWHNAQVVLDEGEHTIRMDYYENAFSAIAILDSVFTPADEGGGDGHQDHEHPYEVKYWNLPNTDDYLLSPPEIPSVAPHLTTSEQNIGHYWGISSPVPGIINPDRFVAQWTKHQYFDGNVRFTTVSDDGVRVYLGNTLIIDQWNDHSATTHMVDVTNLSGTYDITVQYYENGFDAVMMFGYEQL